MRIQIGGELEVNDTLRTHVERRLAFGLSRFGERVGAVTVTYTERASETRCRIDIELRRSVRVEDSGPDAFTAADSAVDRAARSVARVLERELGRDERDPHGPKK